MRFFLDLEALQFTGRVISLGCVAENGKEFYSLMKPSKKGEKVTQFITDLTGITNEMLKEAPTSEEVFTEFYNWVCEQAQTEPTFFFCYGNEDNRFLQATARYINNKSLKSFIKDLSYNLGDYAKIVDGYFNIKSDVKLKRVWEYFYLQEIEQVHNALDDARMLFQIAVALEKTPASIDNIFKQEEEARIAAMKERQKVEEQSIEATIINLKGKWVATEITKGIIAELEFKDLYEAAIFFYMKLSKENQQQTQKSTIGKRIKNAILSKKPYMGYEWICEYKEKEGE